MIESEYSNEWCEKCQDFQNERKEFEGIIYNRTAELCDYIHKYKTLKTNFIILCVAYLILLFVSFNANAQDLPCSRAKLTYTPPATRVNGTPLTIDELNYYEVKVIDQATGETDFYILDQYNVVNVDGPVNERVFTTKENQNFPLRLGMQCFSIRVVDTEGLKSVWSDEACKELCSFNNFELKIRLGISENN